MKSVDSGHPSIAHKPAKFLDKRTVPHIATLILVAALSALSMNMFLPSLPSLAKEFATSSAIAQLAISGYLACTALMQLFIGPLSDRYGRRPIMLFGGVCFILGSVICMFAQSIEVFLFGRVVQSVVATGMVLSRATVRDLVGQDEAASMIGYVTMAMTLAPMLAPVVGGLLDENFGWRSSFALMLVLGIGVLAVVYADFGETNKNASASFSQQFASYPELLTSRRFWGFTLTTMFSSGCFFAYLGGGPFVGRQVFELSPSQFGTYFTFTGMGYMLGNFLSGRYAVRFGVLPMILTGCMVSVVGMIIPITINFVDTLTPFWFFGPLFFLGLGNGMTLPSANAGVVSVRPKLAGSAAGLSGALQIGGGSFLSAVAAGMVNVENGGMGLLYVMICSAIGSIFAILYVVHVERLVNANPNA